MRTEIHEYTKIIADEGYFLTDGNGLYGYEIVLGLYDTPERFTELPISQYPTYGEQETGTGTGTDDVPNPNVPNRVAIAKTAKLREIDNYDLSPNVNGFFYNGVFMWLDRETRASLKNTIESLVLLGRNTLNIWYGDVHVEVDVESARMLLAALEVYATDCYNVTATHKAEVSAMTEYGDIISYNVTIGYPERLSFGGQTEQQGGEMENESEEPQEEPQQESEE